jgi:hypothetical protein
MDFHPIFLCQKDLMLYIDKNNGYQSVESEISDEF